MLTDLGIFDGEGATPRVPVVEVWNKWDLLDAERAAELKDQIRAHPDDVIVPLSAMTGEGCDDLLDTVGRLLTADARLHEFVIPVSDGQRIAWLHAHGEVVSDEDAGESADETSPRRRLGVRLTPRELGRYIRL